MTEKEYLIALNAFLGFGPVRLKLLITYFKKAGNIWNANKNDLVSIGLSQKLVNKFANFRENFDYQKYFLKMSQLNINAYTIFEQEYPENLRQISDAPYVLYVRGNIKKSDSKSVAIVGTRLMTGYGREATNKLATEFANFGITIISGLALGIDAEAQRSALSAGGRTIAVLASGLDVISPFSNKSLAMEILNNKGALVSEYPLGHLPFKSDFAVRNRLISGLSKAVVVVEGRMKSGTFYTVNAAADQGRPVFAVPGPITSDASEGPNFLIQNGAKLVTNAKDILEEINLEFANNSLEVERVMPEDPEDIKILEYLSREPLHLDELVRISGRRMSDISARLTFMEIKGFVKNIGSGIYKKI